MQLLKFYDNLITQYHIRTVQFSNVNDVHMINQWWTPASLKLQFWNYPYYRHGICKCQVFTINNSIMHYQQSSRMKNLMFRNNFSKFLTLDTKHHFLLKWLSKSPSPHYNLFGTYICLEMVTATYKQDFCPVLRHGTQVKDFFVCTASVNPVQAQCKTTHHNFIAHVYYLIVAGVETNCSTVTQIGIFVREKVTFTPRKNQVPCKFSYIICSS